jgi:hypothetical protein
MKALVVKSDTTIWYQSQGFNTEPRWASGAVFDRECEEKLGLKWPISDLGLFQCVK